MINFSPEHLEALSKVFEHSKQVTYKKGDVIVPIGGIYRHIFLIQEGMARVFYIDKNNQEITIWFCKEGTMATTLTSFLSQKPGRFCLEAIEDFSALQMHHDSFVHLVNSDFELMKLYNTYITKTAIGLSDKLIDMHQKSAKERYDNMVRQYPDIFQRVNLGHIATYLGITQQSLSRIRAQH